MKLPSLSKVLCLLLLACLLPLQAQAAPLFIPATQAVPVGGDAREVVSVDFNNDGKMDMAVANHGASNVSVLLGDGVGGFSAAVNYAVPTPISLISADFDGDGIVDLATANLYSGSFSILSGVGDGTFVVISITAGASAFSITSGLFNNDGVMDIAVTDASANTVLVYHGDGVGGYPGSIAFAVGTNPKYIISADFNGDGKLDIVTANSVSGDVSVLLNDGAFGFFPVVNYPVGVGSPRSVKAADFDGDGNLDLVTANNGGSLNVLLGDGTGAFSAPAPYSAGVRPNLVTTADFDGDGNVDMAVANLGGNDVSVLLGDGLGGFSGAVNYPVGILAMCAKAADLNGDGYIDLVVSNINDNTITVLFNDGKGGFPATVNHTAGTNPLGMANVDFNKDGYTDIAVANVNSGVTVSFGDGVGGFGVATSVSTRVGANVVATTDFNKDSNFDMIVANGTLNVNTVEVLLGNGAGGFTSGILATGIQTDGVATGDFNNDGNMDFAVTSLMNNLLNVYYGDGLGGFPTSTSRATSGAKPWGVSAADLNGDGVSDLVVSNYVTGTLDIFMAQNIMGWDIPTTVTSTYTVSNVSNGPIFTAIGDMNADGNLDIVVPNNATGEVGVLLGDGTGQFGVVTAYSTGGANPRDVKIADFNSDGYADVVVQNETSHTIAVLLGDGTGALGAPTSYAAGNTPIPLITGDFNRDGKIDVAVGNHLSNDFSVFINQTESTPPVGTITIDNGAVFSKTTMVNLTLTCSDNVACTQMAFTNIAQPTSYSWMPNASSATWTLPAGDGVKTVYAWFKDAANNGASSVSATITLDTTAPVITLNGVSAIALNIGQAYVDAGATVTDNIDATNTLLVGVGAVDVNTTGLYTITYTDADSAGNLATAVTRTVTVAAAGTTNNGTTLLATSVAGTSTTMDLYSAGQVIFGVNSTAITANLPANTGFPFGVIDFYTSVTNQGDSQTVVLTFSDPLPANFVVYTEDSAGNYVALPASAWTKVDANTISITLSDGDALLDKDGFSDGQIHGLIAIGEEVVATGTGKLPVDAAGGGGGCLAPAQAESQLFAVLPMFGLMLLGFVGLRKRD